MARLGVYLKINNCKKKITFHPHSPKHLKYGRHFNLPHMFNDIIYMLAHNACIVNCRPT